MDRSLSRGRYATAGVLLMAVKIGIDLAVSKAFGKPYSVLFYISRPTHRSCGGSRIRPTG
jgi:hypothetical protein